MDLKHNEEWGMRNEEWRMTNEEWTCACRSRRCFSNDGDGKGNGCNKGVSNIVEGEDDEEDEEDEDVKDGEDDEDEEWGMSFPSST